MSKRTKIIATLGPATSTQSKIEELITAGVNVFRLNFSHGDHQSHLELINTIRRASEKTGAYAGILGDLCGPKIRTGRFTDGPINLNEGDVFFLSEDPDELGTSEGIGSSYPFLTKDLKPGSRVLLDDGNFTLEALKAEGNRVYFKVIEGGLLKNNKGINIPNIPLSVETITEKDKEDLKFMLEHEIDFVALSFVRKADDLIELRRLMGDKQTFIIAKIEKPEAIDQLESILDHCDGIMIARGDLGVEVPIEKVPALQRYILTRCGNRGKTVITATQMLESMIDNQRPTRAETTDVFNAVIEGSDAIMLSGETAIGRHPVKAVQTMAAIAAEAELANSTNTQRLDNLLPEVGNEIENIMAHAACEAAMNVTAKAIIPFTHSGTTALNISKYHPPFPIFALTPKIATCRKLALSWGVTPILVNDLRNTDEMIEMIEKTLKTYGLAHPGNTLVIVAGVPLGVEGSTNMMKLHRVRAEEYVAKQNC